MRFPAELSSKSVLLEVQYEQSNKGIASTWQAPRLLDGGVVLQTFWELRLPSSLAVLGVPRGWSDENQWTWSGISWKRLPSQNMSSVNEWIGGVTATSRKVDEFDVANPEDRDRYLFSRCGPPAALGVYIVSRSWLVAIFSGAALLIGFLAIFSKLRFRTTWLGIAGVALLAAILAEPSVIFLAARVRSARRGADSRGAYYRALDRTDEVTISADAHGHGRSGPACP